MERQYREPMVEALTVDNVPVIQAARLEDYSPELWALTGSKGAAVLNMLRYVIGDEKFFADAQDLCPGSTPGSPPPRTISARWRKPCAGRTWATSSSSGSNRAARPEFKLEYTIFRTQKGFRVMGKISQDLDTFRMPVDLKIETEGNPEEKRVEVVGTSIGVHRGHVRQAEERRDRPEQPRAALQQRRCGWRWPSGAASSSPRLSEFGEALKEYQKALETNRTSSLAHYRIAEVFFLQNNYQSAANEFREALNGDLEPKWTEVWATSTWARSSTSPASATAP